MTAVRMGQHDMLDVSRRLADTLYFIKDISCISIVQRVNDDQPVATVNDDSFTEARFKIAPFWGSDVIDTCCNLHIVAPADVRVSGDE